DYDYGWLGQHKRGLEHSPGLHPTIEMGARPYNPDLGRFLQIDPIEGGSANDYDYCNADPINCTDLDGQAPWDAITRAVKKVVKKVKEAARATGEWAIRNRRALTAVASVVGAGVCIATAGVGCAIAAGVAFAGNALRSCYDTAVCRTGRAGRNRRWGAFATSVAIDATLAYAGGLAGAVSKSADIGRVGTYVVRAHGQAFGLAEDLSN
ncbi:MAG TPA: RHS repeat-associated core domain-containing protein, partial [Microthrixaceae bacterium]|nr:RHS repeat-associated core domain-containing protein [Microthrixaceae bacterium]